MRNNLEYDEHGKILIMYHINTIQKYDDVFASMRDPVKARISAYNWIKQKCNYQKIFEKYMHSGDYMLIANDNKTRMSTFGLSQTEYIEGSNCKLFVFENFENVLDYIDCIFGKSIHRMDQKKEKKHKYRRYSF